VFYVIFSVALEDFIIVGLYVTILVDLLILLLYRIVSYIISTNVTCIIIHIEELKYFINFFFFKLLGATEKLVSKLPLNL
jgi:hypothetical protein